MKVSPTILEHQLPSREQIEERAFQIFQSRGAMPGHEVDDWLQAEYELTQLPIRKLAGLTTPKAKKKSGTKKTKASRSALIALVQTAVLLGSSAVSYWR